jgi:hypothetical protein
LIGGFVKKPLTDSPCLFTIFNLGTVEGIQVMTKAAAIFAIVLTLGLGVAFVASSLSGSAWAGQQDQKP